MLTTFVATARARTARRISRVLVGAAAIATLTTGLGAATQAAAGEAGPGRPLSGRAVNLADAPLLRSTDPEAARFRSVGRVSTGSTCTGTLVGSGTPSASTKAFVLTAGHCIGFLGANEVRSEVPADASWSFTPAYFVDTAAQHRSFPVAKVRYATMKGVDLALVELNATYGELAAINVRPLDLSATLPGNGQAIEAVHAPVMGVPEDQQYLRRSVCGAKTPTDLAEGSWVWTGTSPNDCAGIAGGSSGGLVVRSGTQTVASVVNTTVDPTVYGSCKLNRPCEIGAAGVQLKPGTSYGIGLSAMTGCLRPGPVFNLGHRDCRLDPGRSATPFDQTQATQSQVKQPDGTVLPARWAAQLTANGQRYARYKTGPLGRVDCKRAEGYGPVFEISTKPTVTDLLPSAEDFYTLCLQSGPTATVGSTWVPLRYASYTGVQVDDTPPTIPPVINANDVGDSWAVEPIFRLFEIVDYDFKYGAPDSTDCADPAGYRPYRRFPAFLDKQQTWRYCAIGYDQAGNPTPPKALELP